MVYNLGPCFGYQDFVDRGRLLTRKLLSQVDKIRISVLIKRIRDIATFLSLSALLEAVVSW